MTTPPDSISPGDDPVDDGGPASRPAHDAASRTGHGVDAHRLTDTGTVVLAGVTASTTRGVVATSDGDVAAHAVCDALLGAAALGDIGDMFPSSDAQWHDADSMEMLSAVVARLGAAGFAPVHIDVTIIAESIRVAPHREAMRSNLAATLGLDPTSVSVKATTTDGMGFLGRDEGIASLATATIRPLS